jgi:hypothetical protein
MLAMDPAYYPYLDDLMEKMPAIAAKVEADDLFLREAEGGEYAAFILTKSTAGIALLKKIVSCNEPMKQYFRNKHQLLRSDAMGFIKDASPSDVTQIIDVRALFRSLSRSPEGVEVMEIIGIKESASLYQGLGLFESQITGQIIQPQAQIKADPITNPLTQ